MRRGKVRRSGDQEVGGERSRGPEIKMFLLFWESVAIARSPSRASNVRRCNLFYYIFKKQA
jgi:hypothetical protein